MDEAVIKRIMPHDSLAERSVVGCMLTDKQSIDRAAELITKDDFYEKQYGLLFEAMVRLNNESKPVDVVTLRDKLNEMDVPEEVSSLGYLQDIMDLNFITVNIRQYATIVKERALYRKMIKTMEEISDECYDPGDSLNVIFENAEKKVFDIVQKRNTGDFVPIREIVAHALERMQKLSQKGGRITGIPSGFKDLDEKTSGFQPSDLVLVAARPSMGKTAFVLNVAQHVCLKENMCVAIFSLEMSKEQLINRLLSVDSMVEAEKIRNADFEGDDVRNIVESANRLAGSRMIIDDTPGITIGELQSKCRKYKLEMGLDMVIIDYLQLMGSSGRSDSRQQEVSDNSRGLKALARELDVPVITLSQLSRAVEKREDHRPMLSDLRESGAIEQDADVVMFLYREDYYKEDTENKNVTEIIIAKQRNGPVGKVKLSWLAKYTKFADLARDYND
ncbi:MAG: replicative DNA helicase [Lachnospiraceae bacterium]|nr:replicative DNA helicase [Lachnospiraceae bacterium]